MNQKRQQLEGNVKDVQDSIRSMSESPHDMADQAVADLAQETPEEGEAETAQATEEMVNDQALEETAGEAEAHDVWDQQEALAEAADGTEVVNANESTDENETAPMEDAGTFLVAKGLELDYRQSPVCRGGGLVAAFDWSVATHPAEGQR